MILQLANSNQTCLIDDEDYQSLPTKRWNLSTLGYVVVGSIVKGQPSFLHRIIMKAERGQFIDHINGNKLDNRKQNLRFCTLTENQFNRVKQESRSKYKGVGYSYRDRSSAGFLSFKNRTNRLHTGSQVECAYAYDCATAFVGHLSYKNNVDNLLSEDIKTMIKQKVENKLRNNYLELRNK